MKIGDAAETKIGAASDVEGEEEAGGAAPDYGSSPVVGGTSELPNADPSEVWQSTFPSVLPSAAPLEKQPALFSTLPTFFPSSESPSSERQPKSPYIAQSEKPSELFSAPKNKDKMKRIKPAARGGRTTWSHGYNKSLDGSIGGFEPR